VIALLVLQLAIAAPVAARDTTGHVDMRIGQSITLGVNTAGAKWSSGNPTIASVTTKGVVSAKAAGYATITATDVTRKATIRVCVTASDQEQIPWKIKSIKTPLIGESRMWPGTQRQIVAHIQLVASPDMGPCVHWILDRESSEFGRIDRAGVVHSSRTVRDVKAFIGPRLP
jgi:hypothetical protein